MKWVLTPDEFAHVWATETDLDRRPYPVNMIPESTVRTESQYAALRLPSRYARNTDPDLTAALLLCTRPDATTFTVSGRRGLPGTEAEQILAFAAVVHRHAALLVARPDAVSVTVCHARGVGERLVAAIGSAPAGKAGPMREPQDAVLDPATDAGTDGDITAPRRPGAARFRRTLRAPVDSRGFITVTVAPDNPMSPPTRHRTWLDITGDGRYLLSTAAELTLTPVGDAEFAAVLLRLAGIG
ncbi:ESX secretion-associated protein EspG [Nocardia veterana]|uniref:ESX secretion-associated protein EspG n=1 Tax=Nocardia veterana TaxID=132249 RepID=A0A7X6M2B4_9NOCA|nr:ESX secretion-associated protein EspG [Nocardia veterana]NKY89028.1 ESX secretion-associated protein EspG [Nocardia veterana]